ncbi:reverse transcriptase domain-containing protein [Tanacetum coccineum]
MADNRTMEELLRAPTEGYEEAIVIPEINTDHFEIKTNLLQLVQASPFHGFERENPHTHISNFKRITSTMKFRGVPNDVIKLMMFPYSLEGDTRVCQINELKGNFSKQEENLGKNLNNDMRSILSSFFQNQASTSGTLPSNTIPNPKGEMKAITTRSSATLAGPSVPPPSPSKVVDQEPEMKTDQELTESTNKVPPLVVQSSPDSTKLPSTPISSPKILKSNPHQPPIPYPSRLNKEKLQGEDDIQIHSFLQMFKKIHFNISFSEALAHMPKFEKMVKDLLTNKEKLLEIANIPVNENYSVVILKKLPKNLGDTRRFLIPCEFFGLESCMALADLEASNNLMPLSVWKKLSLPELSTTQMTLELATRTIAVPEGIAEDVFVQVGKFTFPSDFVVVDYVVDSRVPLIFSKDGSCFRRYLFLERLLDNDSTPDLSPTSHPVGLINDAKNIKSSIEDPLDLELKNLPSHLEYAFLEGTSKLPVIIAKDLKEEEKEQLLKSYSSAGFLTRDSRIVERKKPGKAKARKRFQWVKQPGHVRAETIIVVAGLFAALCYNGSHVGLCGHATLAASHFLFKSGLVNSNTIEFSTLSDFNDLKVSTIIDILSGVFVDVKKTTFDNILDGGTQKRIAVNIFWTSIMVISKEIQIPRKRKRGLEDASASAITFGKVNKRRSLNPADKTEKGMEDKLIEAVWDFIFKTLM